MRVLLSSNKNQSMGSLLLLRLLTKQPHDIRGILEQTTLQKRDKSCIGGRLFLPLLPWIDRAVNAVTHKHGRGTTDSIALQSTNVVSPLLQHCEWVLDGERDFGTRGCLVDGLGQLHSPSQSLPSRKSLACSGSGFGLNVPQHLSMSSSKINTDLSVLPEPSEPIRHPKT